MISTCYTRFIKSCIAVFFTAALAQAETEFNILDPGLKKCLQEAAAKNNWQSPEEFTFLKCHSKGIESLAGLERFSHIEKLSVYNNKLKYIDFDLAKLPQLIELNAARNSLKKIDLAGHRNLTSIFLFGNQIQKLSLTDMNKLTLLKAHNNKIETFTYSNLPELKKIYIFNNKIKTLNIHEFQSLQYMDCRENPMPDELYDEMDEIETTTFLHDGNAEDW